jgi:3-phosphoinositide dependent protein kinase-1
VQSAQREKKLLTSLAGHPGILNLRSTMQDTANLYFVTELCLGGEFQTYINSFKGSFPLSLAKHYTAELISILEFLHTKHIAHRDLKPSNLLLSGQGHLKLIDFGAAKDYTVDDESESEISIARRGTFVGTADYVSPEILNDSEAGPAVDLWAVGCILYLLLVGKTPFRAQTEFIMFERICSGNFEVPPGVDPEGINLVQRLLVNKPAQRLGAGMFGSDNDYASLKSHPFFTGIDFSALLSAPIAGFVAPIIDVENVEEDYEEDEESDQLSEQIEEEEDQILVEGIVQKKAGWIYRKRRLVVTSRPSIEYWTVDKHELKGSIELSERVRADVTGKNSFLIAKQHRVYYFKAVDGTPEAWVHAINLLIEHNFKPRTS